jgi:hypothetical protein
VSTSEPRGAFVALVVAASVITTTLACTPPDTCVRQSDCDNTRCVRGTCTAEAQTASSPEAGSLDATTTDPTPPTSATEQEAGAVSEPDASELVDLDASTIAEEDTGTDAGVTDATVD